MVEQAKVGRPRDARLDAAIVQATVELLEERGYGDLSLAAIAERAGTTTPSRPGCPVQRLPAWSRTDRDPGTMEFTSHRRRVQAHRNDDLGEGGTAA